ncbi:hypothetical protein [Variovorax sp. dw_308]|uniref:hypothetical protein n=1 Tax=Variovorax sp. dw_308 TaxID=2721546 RepID=UPI001C4932B4|nr:hypothetical protein [Variovorax sp. dw_308]
MSALDLLNHLLNFVAPAFFVTAVLALLAGFLMPTRPQAPARWVQFAINLIAGVAVLAGGLAWFGHDGMIATYAALVVVCGTGQWLLAQGWRR